MTSQTNCEHFGCVQHTSLSQTELTHYSEGSCYNLELSVNRLTCITHLCLEVSSTYAFTKVFDQAVIASQDVMRGLQICLDLAPTFLRYLVDFYLTWSSDTKCFPSAGSFWKCLCDVARNRTTTKKGSQSNTRSATLLKLEMGQQRKITLVGNCASVDVYLENPSNWWFQTARQCLLLKKIHNFTAVSTTKVYKNLEVVNLQVCLFIKEQDIWNGPWVSSPTFLLFTACSPEVVKMFSIFPQPLLPQYALPRWIIRKYPGRFANIYQIPLSPRDLIGKLTKTE